MFYAHKCIFMQTSSTHSTLVFITSNRVKTDLPQKWVYANILQVSADNPA